MYDRIVAAPGQALELGGPEGGQLLVQPAAPGAMSLTDMQNRTWHLLREDGPDTGFAAPTTGDFVQSVVTRDLNIALGQLISETGLAPALSDRMDTFPVFPVLDYPLPPALVALARVEYKPAGSYTYKLEALSMEEFDSVTGGILPPTTGQPRYYRVPYAGYIRLQPQPSQGNAVGPGTGSLTIASAPVAGQQVTATIVNGSTTVTTIPYVVLSTDTTSTIATALSSAINKSAAVTGGSAFLSPTSTSANVVTITALQAPGTAITIQGAITGNGATIAPTSATNLSPTGDTITFYYTSLGTVLVNGGDSPGIPPQFHMAPVYRVLSDYWERKSDPGQSDRYLKKYDLMVKRAKAYVFDSQRSTQPTIAGDDIEYPAWPEGIG